MPRLTGSLTERGAGWTDIDYKISKRLSYLLRHAADSRPLPLRLDGFMNAAALMREPELKAVSWSQVLWVVRSNYKKRFDVATAADYPKTMAYTHSQDASSVDVKSLGGGSLRPVKRSTSHPVKENRRNDGRSIENISLIIIDAEDSKLSTLPLHFLYIRASQGHSIKWLDVKLLYEKIEDPKEAGLCVHGTTRKKWEVIRNNGLDRMQRSHIHFAIHLPGEAHVISGVRQSSELGICINVKEAMENGINFYKSTNGVILSDGIDGTIKSKYFSRVIDLSTRQPIDIDT